MERESILLVGDGDMSFSASMIPQWSEKSVMVSCLESQEELVHKYSTAAANIEEISKIEGWAIAFGVDATQLSSSFPDRKFDRVQFNFPHSGGKSNIKRNRQLLRDFFRSAAVLLRGVRSCVAVALCRGQGGTPFDGAHLRPWGDCWQVQEAAAEAELLLLDVRPFAADAAYAPTGFRSQARGFSTDGALLHIFAPAHRPVEVSADPLRQVEDGLSCYRHVARVRDMRLHQLEGHPFHRTARLTVSRLLSWRTRMEELTLDPSCLSDAEQGAWPLISPSGATAGRLPASPGDFLRLLPPSREAVAVVQAMRRHPDVPGAVQPLYFVLARTHASVGDLRAWTWSLLADGVAIRAVEAANGDGVSFSAPEAKGPLVTVTGDASGAELMLDVALVTEAWLGVDSVDLVTDDPRLAVEPGLVGGIGLCPRRHQTDLSFWLPQEGGFDEGKMRDATFAIADGTLVSLEVLERYTRPTDGRQGLCVRLCFEARERVLAHTTMHRLQSMVRLYCRDEMGVELR